MRYCDILLHWAYLTCAEYLFRDGCERCFKNCGEYQKNKIPAVYNWQDLYFPPSVYFHENSVYFLDTRQLFACVADQLLSLLSKVEPSKSLLTSARWEKIRNIVCGRRDLSLNMCLLYVCISIWLYACYLDMINVALNSILYFFSWAFY